MRRTLTITSRYLLLSLILFFLYFLYFISDEVIYTGGAFYGADCGTGVRWVYKKIRRKKKRTRQHVTINDYLIFLVYSYYMPPRQVLFFFVLLILEKLPRYLPGS